MRRELLSLLVCPGCEGSFELQVDRADGAEILEGALACQPCRSIFRITRGIPRILPDTLNQGKDATSDAFGYEWSHYSELADTDKKEFLGWMSPLTPSDFEDRVVLDAGCGKGRHSLLSAQFGARTVVGIDLSVAVEAAYRNTRHLDNVHIVQADILNLPFKRPFDLVYSVGVVHHLPSPADGFSSLVKHVKPGGRISVWVYGKEGNAWIEKIVDPVRKNVTSKLPRPVTRFIAFFPATILYVALKLLYRPAKNIGWLKKLLPYSEYLCFISDYSFAENWWNVFDQLVAPTAFYVSQDEVASWFSAENLNQVAISRHNNNSWRGTGVTP